LLDGGLNDSVSWSEPITRDARTGVPRVALDRAGLQVLDLGLIRLFILVVGMTLPWDENQDCQPDQSQKRILKRSVLQEHRFVPHLLLPDKPDSGEPATSSVSRSVSDATSVPVVRG